MKLPAIAMLALSIATPAAAQIRLDMSWDIAKGTNLKLDKNLPDEVDRFVKLASYIVFVPVPELELQYQGDFGALKVGGGVGGFAALIASVAWLNAFVEYDIGSLALEAWLGGGLFAY